MYLGSRQAFNPSLQPVELILLFPAVAQKVVALRKKQQLAIGPCKSLPNSPSHSAVSAASIPAVHINQVRSPPCTPWPCVSVSQHLCLILTLAHLSRLLTLLVAPVSCSLHGWPWSGLFLVATAPIPVSMLFTPLSSLPTTLAKTSQTHTLVNPLNSLLSYCLRKP